MGSLFGYEVLSELPLGRLSEAPGPRGRIHMRHTAGEVLDRQGELTALHEGPDGAAFALASADDGLLAWCSMTGAFHIDGPAARITAAPTANGAAWENRFATTAVPLLLAERGDLALHAAAVETDAGAILFCGPSGRGKSTVALLSARAECGVIAEDGVVVEIADWTALAWPGPRGVRASDESRAAAGLATSGDGSDRRVTRLRTLTATPAPADRSPVVAVVALAPRGAKLIVKALPPAEALAALAPSLVHRGGPDGLRPALGLLARLVEIAPVHRATMPDDLDRASAAAAALRDSVAV